MLDDYPAHQARQEDRHEALEDAPAQFLDVVEEGHFAPVLTSLRHAGPPRPRPQTRERLPPQALELVAREVGLWRAGVAGDDPGVVRPRRCGSGPAPGRAGGPALPAARAARSDAAGSGPSAPARSRAAAARRADRSSCRRAAAPNTPAARRVAPARRRAAPARSPLSPRAGYPRVPARRATRRPGARPDGRRLSARSRRCAPVRVR